MNLRAPLPCIFSHLIVIFLVTGCDNSTPPKQINPDPFLRSYSNAEREFLQKAGQLQRHVWDGQIGPEEFRKIHETHNQWLAEFSKQTSQTIYPSIGTDSKHIYQTMESQWNNENHYGGLDFQGLDLRWANLVGVNLNDGNIRGSKTRADNLTFKPETDFSSANLIGADVERVKGQKALLRFALLMGSDFSEADLSEAVLWYADLRWSAFQGTNLNNAELHGAKMEGVIYEPRPNALPNLQEIAYAQGLHGLTFEANPGALVELRTAFDNSGFHNQARQITHAIWTTKRKNLSDGSIMNRLESSIYFVFLELTSKYGMEPFRPLTILILLVPVFSLPYMVAVFRGRRDGIWVNRFETARKQEGVRQMDRNKVSL